MTRSLIVIAIVAFLAMIVSVFLWGFPWWIVVHLGLFTYAMIVKGVSVSGNIIMNGVVLALDMSVYAWGLLIWIPMVIAAVSIVIIVLNFTNPTPTASESEAE